MKVRSQVPAWPRLALVLGTAALVASAQTVIAGERSRPSDSSGPSVRVERNNSGSSSSSGSSSRPSSGSSGSASSRDSGDRSSARSDDASRTRPSWDGSPSHGRTRVEGDRGSRGGHHRGRGGRHPNTYSHPNSYSHSYYWGWYGGYYWPWWGWNDPYYPYYYYARHPGYDRLYYWYENQERSGALDFDVTPETAEIWVDGQQVGTADDFDGFPTYLWLPEGSYQIAVYQDGYETLVRDYEVRSGVVIDLADHLQPGEAQDPEEIYESSAPRRQRSNDRDSGDSWYWKRGGGSSKAPAGDEEAYDVRGEPGRVKLAIEPSDASVYLDGRFLGTAEELARLKKGLIIDPGEHRLQVVRPGFETEERTFTVEGEQETSLEIVLERE